jgi:hypothetical protein
MVFRTYPHTVTVYRYIHVVSCQSVYVCPSVRPSVRSSVCLVCLPACLPACRRVSGHLAFLPKGQPLGRCPPSSGAHGRRPDLLPAAPGTPPSAASAVGATSGIRRIRVAALPQQRRHPVPREDSELGARTSAGARRLDARIRLRAAALARPNLGTRCA